MYFYKNTWSDPQLIALNCEDKIKCKFWFMKSAEAIYLEAFKKKNRNQMILMVTIKNFKNAAS